MTPPPAVSNDSFAANRSFGRLALAVKATNGITRRAHVREEGPLRVRCPGAPSAELEAVIVNTAGGVAGGDSFVIDVSVGRDSRTQRIYTFVTLAVEDALKGDIPERQIVIKQLGHGVAGVAMLRPCRPHFIHPPAGHFDNRIGQRRAADAHRALIFSRKC